MNQWMENSFFDHVDKFANSLGYEPADIALTLAGIPWSSPQERDAFIQSITGRDVKGGQGNTLSAKFQKGGSK